MAPEAPAKVSMRIRRYQPLDESEWLPMRGALWPGGTADAHAAEMRKWAARPDADGCDTSPVAYLEGIYVDPDVRRRGLATALVEAAEGWAREQGYRKFASDALLDNVSSQKTHEALGFVEVERAVRYRKTL